MKNLEKLSKRIAGLVFITILVINTTLPDAAALRPMASKAQSSARFRRIRLDEDLLLNYSSVFEDALQRAFARIEERFPDMLISVYASPLSSYVAKLAMKGSDIDGLIFIFEDEVKKCTEEILQIIVDILEEAYVDSVRENTSIVFMKDLEKFKECKNDAMINSLLFEGDIQKGRINEHWNDVYRAYTSIFTCTLLSGKDLRKLSISNNDFMEQEARDLFEIDKELGDDYKRQTRIELFRVFDTLSHKSKKAIAKRRNSNIYVKDEELLEAAISLKEKEASKSSPAGEDHSVVLEWVTEVEEVEASPIGKKQIRFYGEDLGKVTEVLMAEYDGVEYAAKIARESSDNDNLITPQAEILYSIRDMDGICKAEHFLQLNDGTRLILFKKFNPGETLQEKMKKGKISEDEALEIIIKASHIVKELHERGVRHWDIKPLNIWVGDDGQVLLFDFDFAHRTEEEFLARDLGKGKAKQPFSTDLDDIYCLGETLATVLIGDWSNDWYKRILDDQYKISTGLRKILLKASNREYKTADALIEALTGHLDLRKIHPRDAEAVKIRSELGFMIAIAQSA